jgi:putative membrane protein
MHHAPLHLRRNPLPRGLALAVVAGIFLAGSLSAAPRWRTSPAAKSLMLGFAADPVATDTLRPTERAFLEKAAELSRREVRLGQLAVAQAASSALREFAQQLVADHQQIADSVDALRRSKGGSAVQVATPEATPDAYQKLTQKSGAEFDREFIRLLVESHNDALALFERALDDVKDPDVRALIGANLPTLRDHQNRVTELKKSLD